MCRLVPAANSASYISFMADAHWAASARMPSNLLLAEAVSAAQEAGRHGHHPDALQWVVVLQHLRHCCQAYRQVLAPTPPPPPPPSSSSSSLSSSSSPPPPPPPLPHLLLLLPTTIPALLILLLLLSPLCIFPCRYSSSSPCSLLLPLALSNTAQSAANFRYPPSLSSPPPHETASRKQV